MPLELYFSQPSNSSFHNLCTSNIFPTSCHSLLGLGLNFCPRPSYTLGTSSVDLLCFHRDTVTRMFCAHSHIPIPPLFIRSSWEPPLDKISPDLLTRITTFCQLIQSMFHQQKRSCSNLLPSQWAALHYLRHNPSLIVFKSDKNLGPVILERSVYISRALHEHLLTDTYQQLTEQTATCCIQGIKRLLCRFIANHTPPYTWEQTFLERSMKVSDPFGYFYLLAKIHKTPWVTRPIVSVNGSLLHGLSRWTDFHLQQLVHRLPCVYHSSSMVVDCLRKLPLLHPNTCLFTMDARSMYTNIDTISALEAFQQFFNTSPYYSLPCALSRDTNTPGTPAEKVCRELGVSGVSYFLEFWKYIYKKNVRDKLHKRWARKRLSNTLKKIILQISQLPTHLFSRCAWCVGVSTKCTEKGVH